MSKVAQTQDFDARYTNDLALSAALLCAIHFPSFVLYEHPVRFCLSPLLHAWHVTPSASKRGLQTGRSAINETQLPSNSNKVRKSKSRKLMCGLLSLILSPLLLGCCNTALDWYLTLAIPPSGVRELGERLKLIGRSTDALPLFGTRRVASTAAWYSLQFHRGATPTPLLGLLGGTGPVVKRFH